MKKILVKFSDERNKKYSIRTTIAEDEKTKERIVLKESIYPEGEEHLFNIVRYAELLTQVYPEARICPVRMLENKSLQFDFVKGISLETKYQQCLLKNDRAGMEELLLEHEKLVIGADSNVIDFQETPQFVEIFGIKHWMGDVTALQVVNFDATASNIIYQDGVPTFIDYEWVFEIPIPKDLAVYHCVRDVYFHMEGLEAFYPLQEAIRFLKIDTDLELLEDAYKKFYMYVIKEKDGSSFGLTKSMNLMGTVSYDENAAGNANAKEKMQMELALAFAEKNWKEACQANAVLSQQIPKLEQEIEVWKDRVEQEQENHRIHAKQIEDAVMEQARQSEVWRVAYESVINSRTWRIAKKFKKLFGRG